MKFAERGLILLCMIGLYLAAWHKPSDLSVLFAGGGLLAVLYLLVMPFLLMDAPLSALFNEVRRQAFRLHHWVWGYLFGVLSAYCVFSIIYHQLGQMDSLALMENCGTGLAVFALPAFFIKENSQTFYRNLRIRAGLLLACLLSSLIVRFLLERQL